MAGLAVGLMLLFGGSPLEATRVVAVYIAASLLVVGLGVLLERAIHVVSR
ncbi:hypothetical protein ACNS7O_17155 (plasmid) [Haloferacaceae archaeon DSL9]